MEEIGATNPKYQPLRVLWHPFVRPRSKTILLVLIHPFTRQIVYSVKYCCPVVHQHQSRLTSATAIQSPSCHKKVFIWPSFFSFLFYFHCTLFMGFRDPHRESRNLYLKHSFSTYTCLSNNSLISAWISTKFVSKLLLCMLYQTNNFQYKANT